MSFASFNLHPDLLRAVDTLSFTAPTPIQTDAIPPALAGRDVLACAMTGSGKTAAFMLPILQRLLADRKRATRALVLTPTRELAAQIEDHSRRLARHAGVGVASVIGGVSFGPQEPALRLALLEQAALQSVLVFTRTKHRANRLADALERRGIAAARIHGNRSQAQRTAALDGFKRGTFRVLVATDIAARGIDVTAISHVVNFDI